MSKRVGDGFILDANTPRAVGDVLSRFWRAGRYVRLRLWYGDTTTGEAWEDEYHTMGYIGRSTGVQPIPLLIENKRSLGGQAILDSSIVAITLAKGGAFLYKHPTFTPGIWESHGCTVTHNGTVYANCKSDAQAKRLADFMSGRRNNK
jgi:hypothetical protein